MLFMSEGFFLPNQNPFHCKLVSLDSWLTLPGKKRLRNISCMHVLPGFLKSSFIYMISIVILIYETITYCNYNVNFWAREETASDLNSYIFALLIIFFPSLLLMLKLNSIILWCYSFFLVFFFLISVSLNSIWLQKLTCQWIWGDWDHRGHRKFT